MEILKNKLGWAVQIHDIGKQSARISFVELVRWSGNAMSKVMRRSPRRLGCLGYGSPSPVTLFLELGLMTSLQGTEMVLPSMVGTLRVVPIRALHRKTKKKKIKVRNFENQALHMNIKEVGLGVPPTSLVINHIAWYSLIYIRTVCMT